MKIKDGFILRDVGGKTFVVAVGETSKKFKGIITLNETGKLIWQSLALGEESDKITDKILSEYDCVDRITVEKDIESFIEKLRKDGILSE